MSTFDLPDGFELVENPYVLPITLGEFWGYFFANNSLFGSDASHPVSEIIDACSDWHLPTKENKSFLNQTVTS